MPPLAREVRTIRQIAAELEKLAGTLRDYPAGGEGGTRTPEPARRIVRSLKRVNATLRRGAGQQSLKPAAFRTLGREFGKIGGTLLAVGSVSKPRARKATRKTKRR